MREKNSLNLHTTNEDIRNGKINICLFLYFLVAILPMILNFTIPYYQYFALVSFFLISLIMCFIWNGGHINRSYNLAAILFCALQCISVFLSQLTNIPNTNLQTSLAYGLNIFSFLVLISNFKVSEKDVHQYFNLHLILALYACVVNLQKNYRDIISLNVNISNPYFVSFASFFGGRNAFGAFLLSSNIIAFCMWLKTRKKRYIACLVLFSFNLFFTFSRSSIFSFLVFLTVYLLIQNRKTLLKLLPLGIVAGSALVWLINSQYFQFIKVFLIREDYGLAGRDDVWVIAKDVIISNPVFGYGIGAAKGIFAENGDIASSFHNIYLECLVNGGIILLIIYMLFLVWLLLRYVRIMKFDKMMGAVYIAYWVSYIIYKLFESGLYFAIGDRAVLETIFAISIPLLYLNYLESNKTNT